MTDPEMPADRTYIRPSRPMSSPRSSRRNGLTRSCRRSAARPPSTARSSCTTWACSKWNVEMIGARPASIAKAEGRLKVPRRDGEDRTRLRTSKSRPAYNIKDSRKVLDEIRSTAGGDPARLHAAAAVHRHNPQESSTEICARGLQPSLNSEVPWSRSRSRLEGDSNSKSFATRTTTSSSSARSRTFDPMGVHTGDSITVAPAQTLSDRSTADARRGDRCLRRSASTGGSNVVQFAINPKDGRMIVIEMNPRVSRSSALASKATGFPIAKIAAKPPSAHRSTNSTTTSPRRRRPA